MQRQQEQAGETGRRATGTASRHGRWAALGLALAAVAVLLALASGTGSARAAGPDVPEALARAAGAAPDTTFDVIIQGDPSEQSDKLVRRVGGRLRRSFGARGGDVRRQSFDGLRDQFDSIDAVSVTVTGRELQRLIAANGMNAITLDAPVHVEAAGNSQKWADSVAARWYWGSPAYKATAGQTPTIAIVDSGVSAPDSDLGPRLVRSVNLSTSLQNTPFGDGYGHGTMVAGLAAGASLDHSGVAMGARIVSLDVVDDTGSANTSDVIRACDWILANRQAYNIRVANFSLSADGNSSFRWDPLDKAVERLWLAGVTVVAAAGNRGTASGPNGVRNAPANDPFVITVGAADVNGTPTPGDDQRAPWSSYGYTNDGFSKPDIGAPGRYMIAPVSTFSTLAREGGQDAKLVRRGYIQLSGTSFAAPIVSGAAAALLAARPDWTPDQVKGALMVSASRVDSNGQWQLGVGELSIQRAFDVSNPPNPNGALRSFVHDDPAGGPVPVFDESSWAYNASANASWASASWSSASWASASWSSASWASASWSSASWASSVGADASWANNAAGDGPGIG